MSDENDTIEPVMTAMEWRRFIVDDELDQYLPRYFAHCAHHVLLAKHNAALPDYSPYKITREDVSRLREWRSGGMAADHAEWTANFIAKLAALLPPES